MQDLVFETGVVQQARRCQVDGNREFAPCQALALQCPPHGLVSEARGIFRHDDAFPDVEVVAVGWWELRNEDFTRFRNIRRGPRIVGQCLKNCQRLAL